MPQSIRSIGLPACGQWEVIGLCLWLEVVQDMGSYATRHTSFGSPILVESEVSSAQRISRAAILTASRRYFADLTFSRFEGRERRGRTVAWETRSGPTIIPAPVSMAADRATEPGQRCSVKRGMAATRL